MSKPAAVTSWILQVVVAVILGQTLFFKFTGAEESVALFTELGIEPVGRIGIGVVELIAVVLVLVPRTAAWGALLGLGLMGGALMSHITTLGFEGERGQLAALAVTALLASAGILWLRRGRLPVVGALFGNKPG